MNPVWSPDGSRIAFASDPDGGPYKIYAKSLAGLQELLVETDATVVPYSWSSDGKYLLFGKLKGSQEDLWLQPLSDDRTPIPYLTTESNETDAEISPDGHWVAYVSNEAGLPNVFIQSFPTPGEKVRISTKGGVQPRWTKQGRELLFLQLAGREIVAVSIGEGPRPRVSEAVPVLTNVRFQGGVGGTSGMKHMFAVTRSGDRIIAMTPVAPTLPGSLNLIMNWRALLKK